MHLVPANNPHIVILGGGYAGTLAALRLAGRTKARITLVNAAPHFVERIRLHQLAAGQSLPHRPLAAILHGTGVQLVVGRAAAIDTANQRVHVEQADGAALPLAWDYLIYALGSEAGRQSLPGAKEHLHSVANEPGAQRLATALKQLAPGGRVAVVGGGLTGIETACELAESHPALRVSLISADEIAPDLSLRGRDYARKTLHGLGVKVLEGARLLAAEAGALVLPAGTLAIDAAVLCAGFAPAQLAGNSGLPINASGQLLIDGALRVPGHDNIFGCGDGAGFGALAQGDTLRMACATAMPMGSHAADNLTALLRGKPLRDFGFSFFIQCVSLGRKHGLVQRVAPDDAPLPTVLTGGIGGRLKEAVCRYTMLSLSIERRLAGTYTWPGRRRSRVVAAAQNLLS